MKKSGGKKIARKQGKRVGMPEKEDKRINVQLNTDKDKEAYKAMKQIALDRDKKLRVVIMEALHEFVFKYGKR